MQTILCVTGRLAERALRATLAELAGEARWEVQVLPITVAALMTADWMSPRLAPPPGCQLILVPGMCAGDLAVVEQRWGIPVRRGPGDLKDLPGFFGREARREGYGGYDALIFAEIPDAPGVDLPRLLRRADYFREQGADVIDLGCRPGERWRDGARAIAALRDQGFRVSIDTFDPWEIRMAADAGAEFILSISLGNLPAARGLTSTAVAVPEPDGDLDSLAAAAARLAEWGVPTILDPILAPVNFGFAQSLHRMVECRRRFPDAPMMLGAHHLTELLDADSTGVTAVIMGFAQELGIRHILTTEVIPWARGAVRELDLARRLMHFSAARGVLPKHLEDGLLTVKDRRPGSGYAEAELREMQRQVRDENFRIFTTPEAICVFNRSLFVHGTDVHALFAQLEVHDASHAFYLGRELTRARIALALGKAYRQEQPLDWGYLTDWEEAQRHDSRVHRHHPGSAGSAQRGSHGGRAAGCGHGDSPPLPPDRYPPQPRGDPAGGREPDR